MLTSRCDNTCNHTNVANEPIGVILGPKSEPITFAYINASRITPDVLVSAIASASIMTVGILFIIEDKKAAMNPMATVTTNNPRSAVGSIKLANAIVQTAFPSTHTTNKHNKQNNT